MPDSLMAATTDVSIGQSLHPARPIKPRAN